MSEREAWALELSQRRALAGTYLIWGVAGSVVALLVSSRLAATVAELVFLLLFITMGNWLLGRRRQREQWDAAREVTIPMGVANHGTQVSDVLRFSLVPVVVLAVAFTIQLATDDGDSSFALGPGLLLGNAFARLLSARDLRRWQEGAHRILLAPAGNHRLMWGRFAADGDLVSAPQHTIVA